MVDKKPAAVVGYEHMTVGKETKLMPIYVPDAVTVGAGNEQKVLTPEEHQQYVQQQASDSAEIANLEATLRTDNSL